MKSERGVTVASIMIYVLALTIAVVAVGRLITYFYKNLNTVNSASSADAQYMKFNSYFTDEINIEGNEVELCAGDYNSSYIVFSKTQNQYTFKNGKIYKGKVKICDNIDECIFDYDASGRKIITVTLKIDGVDYTTIYTVVK